jgi:hypothetical protein
LESTLSQQRGVAVEPYIIGSSCLYRITVPQVRGWASFVREHSGCEGAAGRRLRDRTEGLVTRIDRLRLGDCRPGVFQGVSALVRAWDETDLESASLPPGIERFHLERFEVRRDDPQLDDKARAVLFGDDEAGCPQKVTTIDLARTELGRDDLKKLHSLRVARIELYRVRLEAVLRLAGELYRKAVELGLENRAADLGQALETIANVRIEHLRERSQVVVDVVDIWNQSSRASYTETLKLSRRIPLNEKGDCLANAALTVTSQPDRRAAGEMVCLERAARAGRCPASIADLKSEARVHRPRLEETNEDLVSIGIRICARGRRARGRRARGRTVRTAAATVFAPPIPLGELLDSRSASPSERSGVTLSTAKQIGEKLEPVFTAILESACGIERSLAWLSDPKICMSFAPRSGLTAVALRCANFAINTVFAPLMACSAGGSLLIEPLWFRERRADGSVRRKPVRLSLLRTDQQGAEAYYYYQAMAGWIAAQDVYCGRNLRSAVRRRQVNAVYRWTTPLRIQESFFLSHLDVAVAELRDPAALSLYEDRRDEILYALYFRLIGLEGFLDELSRCGASGPALQALYAKKPARLRKAMRGQPFLFDPAFDDLRVRSETVELARVLERKVGQWSEPRQRFLRRAIKELLLYRVVRDQCQSIAMSIADAREIDGRSDEIALGRALAALERGEPPHPRIPARLLAIAVAMIMEQRDAGGVDPGARIDVFRAFTEEWIDECGKELFAGVWRNWDQVERRISERTRRKQVNASLDKRIEQSLRSLGVRLPRVDGLKAALRLACPPDDLVELFVSALVERFRRTLEKFGCGGPFRWPKSLHLSALNGKSISADYLAPLQYHALTAEHVVIHQQALGLHDHRYFEQYRGFFPFADIDAFRAFLKRRGPVYVASVPPHVQWFFLLQQWPGDPDLLSGFLDRLGWSPYDGKKQERLAKIQNLLALPGSAGATCRALDRLDLAELKALGEFLGAFTKTECHERLVLEPPTPLSLQLRTPRFRRSTSSASESTITR